MMTMMNKVYADFLETKRLVAPASGLQIEAEDINTLLFPFQRDIVRWALRKGRAAIFADTGLGKTFMQIEWARLTGQRTLIVAPLSVARQTVAEGAKLGVGVHYTRSRVDLAPGINITNYEMLEHFDAAAFGAVVLDESSILKGLDGKTRKRLTEMFSLTPYRLCCTATPAPNDITEIANHSEFLGIMPRNEMLACFFIHDDQGWRLKGHAEEPFYRWLASWGMSVKKPSDLGYSDDGYKLPPLDIHPIWVTSDYVPDGQLFATGLHGIQDRVKVRKGTMGDRVEAAADMIARQPTDEQWIVWCGLNAEAEALHRLIPGSVNVEGSMTPEAKAEALEAFQDGTYRVLISKCRIAGFGMNFQNCHRMVFVGLSDSWEQYYQAIRRCYRFGQKHAVAVYIVLSDAEREIYENVTRKEAEAEVMSQRLIAHVQGYEQAEIGVKAEDWTYATSEASGQNWRLLLGDSSERLVELPDESVDLSIYSPPFMSLYTYSPSERDIGNCRTPEEFWEHMSWVITQNLRLTKAGRLCAVHVAQVPAMLSRDGYIGLKDFRGDTIRAYIEHGWIFHGEVTIDKNPQIQAVRTKSKALLFVQLHKDATWSRPAMTDYVLIFRKPGENAVPVIPDISNETWIAWAHGVWYGIRELDTLNPVDARENEDERHMAALQLELIERCIRLWSNPGETVLSPFAGIGSEGHVALLQGRKFIGVELKPSYFKVAAKNLARAADAASGGDLFTWAEAVK